MVSIPTCSNTVNAYKVTSTSCSDGYDEGQNDFNERGQINSKFTEHTKVYQNCYLDGWMNACMSTGNSRIDCESQEDSQF